MHGITHNQYINVQQFHQLSSQDIHILDIIRVMPKPAHQDFTSPQLIEINDNHDGQRIDNFLLTLIKGLPRTHVYRMLRKGEVRVNKGRIKPNYRLKVGDIVRIPPISNLPEPVDGQIPATRLDQLQASILYEDKNILVIDKPSGLAVHAGSGLSYGAIEILRQLRPGEPFLELVHRLDRETSGCLMFAKNRDTLLTLHNLIQTDGMEKRYLAGLKGVWQGGNLTVSAPLRKNILRGGERIVEVSEAGKTAVTHFSLVHQYRDLCLMDIRIETGRTHQIRVHAAHCNHPVAGDEKYGDTAYNRKMKEFGLNRLFLHAHYLSFTMPGGIEITVSAALSPELQSVLNKIE